MKLMGTKSKKCQVNSVEIESGTTLIESLERSINPSEPDETGTHRTRRFFFESTATCSSS